MPTYNGTKYRHCTSTIRFRCRMTVGAEQRLAFSSPRRPASARSSERPSREKRRCAQNWDGDRARPRERARERMYLSGVIISDQRARAADGRLPNSIARHAETGHLLRFVPRRVTSRLRGQRKSGENGREIFLRPRFRVASANRFFS